MSCPALPDYPDYPQPRQTVYVAFKKQTIKQRKKDIQHHDAARSNILNRWNSFKLGLLFNFNSSSVTHTHTHLALSVSLHAAHKYTDTQWQGYTADERHLLGYALHRERCAAACKGLSRLPVCFLLQKDTEPDKRHRLLGSVGIS